MGCGGARLDYQLSKPGSKFAGLLSDSGLEKRESQYHPVAQQVPWTTQRVRKEATRYQESAGQESVTKLRKQQDQEARQTRV